MAVEEWSIDYANYKQQLSLELESIREEIERLEAEGKELDEQLKVQCKQLQKEIDIGKARIELLKAENSNKKKQLNREYVKSSVANINNETKTKHNSQENKSRKSRKEIGWDIAYKYYCNSTNTPDLRKEELNSWVEKVTKNCAKEIRKINQYILEGNLEEIRKITGSILVEKVFSYVHGYVSGIEELADFFGLSSEIRAVYTAFKVILEDFKTTGFHQKKSSRSYQYYSENKHKRQNFNKQTICKRDFAIFRCCTTIKEGKELRKKLSIKNHPDNGGSEEEMKKINHQLDLFIQWMEEKSSNPT